MNFSSNANASSIYNGSLTINSLLRAEGINVLVLAIIKNQKLLYSNTYDSYRFVDEGDGSIKFKGSVFKIELSLTTGDKFDIFYGIVSDTPLSLGNATIDEYCVYILRELEEKCSGIFSLNYYQGAPTRYTYHLYLYSSHIYVTNISGTDAYFISLDGSLYTNGTKDRILQLMSNLMSNSSSNSTSNSAINRTSNYFKEVASGELGLSGSMRFLLVLMWFSSLLLGLIPCFIVYIIAKIKDNKNAQTEANKCCKFLLCYYLLIILVGLAGTAAGIEVPQIQTLVKTLVIFVPTVWFIIGVIIGCISMVRNKPFKMWPNIF